MKTRLNIEKIEPNAYTAMYGLEGYLKKSGLQANYRELIKIRASQINGCAYCIELHTKEARSHGESESRIYALSAWKESPLFSDKERALLQLTEEITLISTVGVSDECYFEAVRHFDHETIAQAIMQIVTINAWNRIAISTRLMHPIPEKAQAVTN